MKFVDCVKFANENPTACFAASDGDQPRVRGLALCFADGKGFLLSNRRHEGCISIIVEESES